jgi:4,5-DOPA dioxygenase extradiol
MAEERMPALFVGHGNPLNAIVDNAFSQGWRDAASAIPRPKAVLCISAHWETRGSLVTAMPSPRTIHDFSGFPRELYEVAYPAPGSPRLAERVIALCGEGRVRPDRLWGLDHGAWSVLSRMFPKADVPVVQMSLDRSLDPKGHYDLCRRLAPLRDEGVLIVGSGNIVHNLYVASAPDGDMDRPYAFPWAEEADAILTDLIRSGGTAKLLDHRSLGKDVTMAVPTSEHYLPMLCTLAVKGKDEPVAFFNETIVAGSISMRSFRIG